MLASVFAIRGELTLAAVYTPIAAEPVTTAAI